MLGFFSKVWDFIRHPTDSRTTATIFILLLLIAIPLTVTISQKQQSIRQRAAGICEQPQDPLKNNCLPCNYNESPDKCGDIKKWCLEIGACANCSPGYLNCDQTEGCETQGNSCPAPTPTKTPTPTPTFAPGQPTSTPTPTKTPTPTPACNYNNGPDGCGNTSSWCLNGACTACTAGYLNCDQTQGCEISGNSCPAPTLTPTPSLELFNFYKEQVLKTTNLNELQKLLVDGINADYIQFKRLTKEQYDILYNNYRTQYTKLTSVQPTSPLLLTPTLTPTTTPSIPVTTSFCSLKSKGDTNCDGTIDILDFNIWLGEFTKTLNTTLSDFNNDGIIDTRDFNIWRNNFLQQP